MHFMHVMSNCQLCNLWSRDRASNSEAQAVTTSGKGHLDHLWQVPGQGFRWSTLPRKDGRQETQESVTCWSDAFVARESGLKFPCPACDKMKCLKVLETNRKV